MPARIQTFSLPRTPPRTPLRQRCNVKLRLLTNGSSNIPASVKSDAPEAGIDCAFSRGQKRVHSPRSCQTGNINTQEHVLRRSKRSHTTLTTRAHYDATYTNEPPTPLPSPSRSSPALELHHHHQLLPYLYLAFSTPQRPSKTQKFVAYPSPTHPHATSASNTSEFVSAMDGMYTHVIRIAHSSFDAYRAWAERKGGVYILTLTVPLVPPRKGSNEILLTDDQLLNARDFLSLALPYYSEERFPDHLPEARSADRVDVLIVADLDAPFDLQAFASSSATSISPRNATFIYPTQTQQPSSFSASNFTMPSLGPTLFSIALSYIAFVSEKSPRAVLHAMHHDDLAVNHFWCGLVTDLVDDMDHQEIEEVDMVLDVQNQEKYDS
ncbi:hypothetical protein BDQ12DRAFT_715654 [Crucibulum laeve]|uniref:Uncharacterized protein n=1 Tax=Crucibulum laeve TaxID=68775 RepID=A0A5C3LP93_9AGAR|nr:hypothetical protein BDQ12DRAFT_715654 [Crucibulum laeve]